MKVKIFLCCELDFKADSESPHRENIQIHFDGLFSMPTLPRRDEKLLIPYLPSLLGDLTVRDVSHRLPEGATVFHPEVYCFAWCNLIHKAEFKDGRISVLKWLDESVKPALNKSGFISGPLKLEC